MDGLALISYFVLFVVGIHMISKPILRKIRRLPPSPFPSLPLIGHLHLLARKPLYKALSAVSSSYGAVVLLDFGSRPVLVVSSPAAAEECFTKGNDVAFANRPRLLAGKHLGYDYTTLNWASYGPHWRNLRRVSALELLSSHRVQALSGVRSDEVRAMIRRVASRTDAAAAAAVVVEMRPALFEVTLNVMMRMIAGKRYYHHHQDDGGGDEDDGGARRFKEIVSETFRLAGLTNVGDFVPILKWVGVGGVEKRMKKLFEKRDEFMKELIEEERRSSSSSSSDGGSSEKKKTMLEVLLSLQESDPEYYTDGIIIGLLLVRSLSPPIHRRLFFKKKIKDKVGGRWINASSTHRSLFYLILFNFIIFFKRISLLSLIQCFYPPPLIIFL